MIRTLKAFFLATVLLAACGGSSKSKTDTTGQTGDGKCAQVLTCVGNCQTDGCVQGCVANISDATKQQITDLVNCSDQAGCTDITNPSDAEACLWNHCDSEMKTCGATKAGIGDLAPSMISVPSEALE